MSRLGATLLCVSLLCTGLVVDGNGCAPGPASPDAIDVLDTLADNAASNGETVSTSDPNAQAPADDAQADTGSDSSEDSGGGFGNWAWAGGSGGDGGNEDSTLRIVADPAGGVGPLDVKLEAVATGVLARDNVSYHWQIDGEDASTSETIRYTFLHSGTHTVRVRAMSGATELASASLDVPVIPEMSIAAEVRYPEGVPILSLQAVVSAEHDTLPAGDYRWEFADGEVLHGVRVTRMARGLGSVAIALSVTIGGIQIGCNQAVVTINDQPPVVADAGPDQVLYAADSGGLVAVQLDGSRSSSRDTTIVRYRWLLGDVLIAEGPEPVATAYLPPGDHRVRLEVVDDQGNVSTDETEIEIERASDALDWHEDFEDDLVGQTPTGWLPTGRDNGLSESPGLFSVAAVGGSHVFGTTSTLNNIHAHFVASAAETWSGYEFTGRMMRSDARGGVGVTFFSDYPHSDTYYRLRAYWDVPFELSPHGTSLDGTVTSDIVPAAGSWYRFKVQVYDDGQATHVLAKVWADGSTEPADWQMEAVDDSVGRRTAGAVGVWAMDAGQKWVDDLAVRTMTPQGGGDENGGGDGGGGQDEGTIDANAGPDQQVVDADGDGVEAVTLNGSASQGVITCYRWKEGETMLAQGPSPIAIVSLPVGTHTITLEACRDQVVDTDTVAVVVQAAPPMDCHTATSSWQNFPFDAQSGTFTVEFLATPHDANMDGIFALSAGTGAAYSDFAVLVRFNTSGTIDARNGGSYAADQTLSYNVGETYLFRIVVDCTAHRYDVYVTPADGVERRIARNYGFRSEQAGVSELANWAIQAGAGTHEVCNVTVEPGQGSDPLPPVADAGADQTVQDDDGDGSAVVHVDASASYDPDGTIVNYRWMEGSQLVAMGPFPTASFTLAAGMHTIELTVTDDSGLHSADTLVVTVESSSGDTPVTMMRTVARHGITWTFDREYPVGQFANGDPFVLGPVTITAISPAPAGGRNGSMVDPPVTDVQAYDSRAYNYDPGLGVTLPLVLQPGRSLVSTQSCDGAEHTYLETAAVLTCLSASPPVGSFRPPYVAGAKPLHNVSELRMELLPSLSPVAGTPSVADVAGRLERVWLDHQPTWHGRFIHPRSNMPDYGREMTTDMGDASLLTLLNVPDKQVLVIRLVQLGIDFGGIADAGGGWEADGGHSSGRKWPIMYAGYLLGDAHMLSIAQRNTPFGEDCQTFYVSQADVDRGVGYTSGQIGMPEWGIRHCFSPEQDDPDWDAHYRRCCTANAWVGEVLSARILGLHDDWNHAALFDYQDRFMQTEPPGRFRSWSLFAGAMWDAYR